jgi:hypothetical protein
VKRQVIARATAGLILVLITLSAEQHDVLDIREKQQHQQEEAAVAARQSKLWSAQYCLSSC